MEAYRSKGNPRPKGRLTPEQVAKLDRIAELAKQSPTIAQAITDHIESLERQSESHPTKEQETP
jgi:predicted transcriptional regulator